jgi:hypothetical protein
MVLSVTIKINILTLVLSEKKILNETKNHCKSLVTKIIGIQITEIRARTQPTPMAHLGYWFLNETKNHTPPAS